MFGEGSREVRQNLPGRVRTGEALPWDATIITERASRWIVGQAAARSEKAMQRRIAQAHLPRRKALEDYDFTFPRKIPKQKVLRLFDCEFVDKHG